MSDAERIIEVERRAKEAGIPIPDLCKAAGIHRATWQRWKAEKTSPTLRQWDAVQAELETREQGRAA